MKKTIYDLLNEVNAVIKPLKVKEKELREMLDRKKDLLSVDILIDRYVNGMEIKEISDHKKLSAYKINKAIKTTINDLSGALMLKYQLQLQGIDEKKYSQRAIWWLTCRPGILNKPNLSEEEKRALKITANLLYPKEK